MEYNPYSPAFVQAVLKKNSLHLSKSRGQNYLIDRNIAEKIVSVIAAKLQVVPVRIIPDQVLPVFEVGSGLGSLTLPIAEKYKIYSLEIDKGIYNLLKSLISLPNLILINRDFLKFDFAEIEEDDLLFISNLPYSISGEAVKRFIDEKKFQTGIVMLQKEFAGRMTAAPGSGEYGVLSILSQNYLNIEVLFDVGKNSFFPVPSIDSTVIQLKKKTYSIQQNDFNTFLRMAFRSKRKTLLNNLKEAGFTPENLEKMNVNPNSRPEEIGPEKWVELYNNVRS
jgi:16S rRNA (adenine1518-N6/adenine1519-N6)-dimethyltransferase